MIRAFYGLTQNPFEQRELELLPQQREIHDTLKVHCQQGGLCLVLGVPGTGKSVIKESLRRLPENQHLVATVARTLHTYTNTVKILCEACRVPFESNAFKCERRLIEQAFSLNHAGKTLTTILDDAHLMDMANLRKLRLLFEDFPKNHNLVLVGQPNLLANLDLAVNHDIKSRVTYSVITKRLNPDDMRPQHLHAARHRPRRSLRRRCLAQGAKPLPRLHDRGRPGGEQDHRYRQRQPRPAATPLAQGGRPRRFLNARTIDCHQADTTTSPAPASNRVTDVTALT
jgi:type II secretory pathway predicted ATPase ExeA